MEQIQMRNNIIIMSGIVGINMQNHLCTLPLMEQTIFLPCHFVEPYDHHDFIFLEQQVKDSQMFSVKQSTPLHISDEGIVSNTCLTRIGNTLNWYGLCCYLTIMVWYAAC